MLQCTFYAILAKDFIETNYDVASRRTAHTLELDRDPYTELALKVELIWQEQIGKLN